MNTRIKTKALATQNVGNRHDRRRREALLRKQRKALKKRVNGHSFSPSLEERQRQAEEFAMAQRIRLNLVVMVTGAFERDFQIDTVVHSTEQGISIYPILV